VSAMTVLGFRLVILVLMSCGSRLPLTLVVCSRVQATVGTAATLALVGIRMRWEAPWMVIVCTRLRCLWWCYSAASCMIWCVCVCVVCNVLVLISFGVVIFAARQAPLFCSERCSSNHPLARKRKLALPLGHLTSFTL
jgi:hypothetical protein